MFLLKLIFFVTNLFFVIETKGLNQTVLLETYGYSKESTFIDLSSKSIDEIDSFTFSGFNHLEILYLNDNKIKTINNKTFRGLTNLRELWIESNIISSIDKNAFLDLNNLALICVHDNPISLLFPNLVNQICTSNQNCIVKANQKCTNIHTTRTSSTTRTTINHWSENSIILTTDEINELIALAQFSKNDPWRLVYRASRDGFSAASFHSKCDNERNTLTIIKSKNGNIFGGFTQNDWSGKGFWKNDPKAFLFSLVNSEKRARVLKCLESAYSIYADSSCGPVFGKENDLFISDYSNVSNKSRSNLGSSYKHPIYFHHSSESKSYLAGSEYFLTSEIEVYSIGDRKIISSILSDQQLTDVIQTMTFNTTVSLLKLIYRASQDGFSASSFHLKCDNKKNTLIIIKTTNGFIFGGYTEANWASTTGHYSAMKSFIFSLINKDNKPIFIKCLNQNCIYANYNYGPVFGGGFDFFIADYANFLNVSYSNLGYSYFHPQYALNSIGAKSFLAGSYNFLVSEIEAFTI